MTPILTQADLSYCAGILDGEGTAGVYHGVRKYKYRISSGEVRQCKGTNVRIAVNMTDSDPVYFMALCFGGSVTKGKTSTGKILYRWQASTRTALYTVLRLLPYLKNKSKVRQVSSVVDYYERLDNKRTR